jgi:diketogulonate reductase-like aldo/keto reductase
MQGKYLDHSILESIAKKHNKTTAQVVLRWDLQCEVVTIPKTSNLSRLRENAEIFDFNLTLEEMIAIDSLNRNERFGYDPDNLPEHFEPKGEIKK